MQNIQIMPNMVSSGDIQRNYRRIFNKVKKNKKPVIVLTNNTPDVAIVNIKELEKLYAQAYQNELNQALEAIEDYKRAKKKGKLMKAKSLADFAK